MIHIGVISDLTWDNFILMNNKFKKINSQIYCINTLYCKTLEIINNCCLKNNLTLIRNYSDSLSKTIHNMLKICNLWLIFTNQVEYNTPSQLIISLCEKYNLNYIIVSEYSRNNDYYSFDINTELTFKKHLSQIDKHYNFNILYSGEEEFYDYNVNFSKKTHVSLLIKPDISSKLKDAYSDIEKQKKDRSICLLYDKEELKKEKQVKKTIKAINQLTFSLNRRNYYKNTNIN